MRTKKKFFMLAAMGTAAVTALLVLPVHETSRNLTVEAHSSDFPKPTFNSKGELRRPEGYRKWVYIGTPLTPNELNPPEAPFPEFHSTYIHPEDFDHYEKTGEFPEGTILIKELVTVGSKAAVSGKGYFMGDFVGLEAAVKDSKRFPDEPGYWAYFSFGHEYPLAATAAAFPAAACNACHQASAAQDFVFTQYYPVLRAARDGGATIKAGAEGGAQDSSRQSAADTGGVDSRVPTDKDGLFQFLKAGGYKEFSAKESVRHPGRGPHSRIGWPVRVYLDPALDASFKAGNGSHPAGSSAVKEMYTEAGELQGWAVMVKTASDSQGGQGWFWYEVTSTTEGAKPVAAGNGLPLCFGCHSTGKDFVLTDYPLQ